MFAHVMIFLVAAVVILSCIYQIGVWIMGVNDVEDIFDGFEEDDV